MSHKTKILTMYFKMMAVSLENGCGGHERRRWEDVKGRRRKTNSFWESSMSKIARLFHLWVICKQKPQIQDFLGIR